MNMKGNEVQVGGGGELTVPYDVELSKVVESVGCLDSAEIMMGRCMAIIHHWKGVVAETSVKVQELERQVQDLLKEKSETEKTLQAQSLAITHLTANLSLLQKEIEAAKTVEKKLKEAYENLKKARVQGKTVDNKQVICSPPIAFPPSPC